MLSDDTFYTESGRPSLDTTRICQNCLVQVRCMFDATLNEEHFGIWGGTHGADRRRMNENPAKRKLAFVAVAETLENNEIVKNWVHYSNAISGVNDFDSFVEVDGELFSELTAETKNKLAMIFYMNGYEKQNANDINPKDLIELFEQYNIIFKSVNIYKLIDDIIGHLATLKTTEPVTFYSRLMKTIQTTQL